MRSVLTSCPTPAAIRWKLNSEPRFSFQVLQRNKRRELERLSDLYRSNLEKAEVNFMEGRGKLIDKNTVEVNGRQYKVSLLSMFKPFCAHTNVQVCMLWRSAAAAVVILRS